MPLAWESTMQAEVVGSSISAPGVAAGNPRAFLWRNGVMTDLNTLAPNSPLYLLIAFGINDAGQIAGFGVDSSNEIHAFLATPCGANQADGDWCKSDAEVAAGATGPRQERGYSSRKMLASSSGD
jgi:probable HAF family extracellular repeat protein